MSDLEALAKLVWQDPNTEELCEYVLVEGSTATIGRSSNNDIQISEQHVSRQHAVVNYRDGIFMITDLGSSNGTYVNEKRIDEPFPLFAGDEVRLYVPIMKFEAAGAADMQLAEETGRLIVPTSPTGQGSLVVTNGPQEGQTIPLLLDKVTIGRATHNATWEVLLQDPSVSRPHARLQRKDDARWYLFDLDSSNGTAVNHQDVDAKDGVVLNDGDMITLGGSILLFRSGWIAPDDKPTMLPGENR